MNRRRAALPLMIMLSAGLGALLGLHAQRPARLPAGKPPAPVACVSGHGSCGGYAGWHDTSTGRPFTRITGTLTVPRALCGQSAYLTSGQSADSDAVWSWIGLGGDPGPTVGQAGILLLCHKGVRWPQIWEWTTVQNTTGAPIRWYREPGVQAGDTVYVSVQALAHGYRLVLKIPAIGWSLADQMPCPDASCVNNTAEAVMEAVAHDDVPVFTGARFAGVSVWQGAVEGSLSDGPGHVLGSNRVARPGGGVLVTRGILDGGVFAPLYVKGRQ